MKRQNNGQTGSGGPIRRIMFATIRSNRKISAGLAASVAGAIAGMVKDGVPVNVQCVGAGAVNQAIKAVAIARGFLIPTGVDISCAPTFSDIEICGENRTAIRIAIYVHKLTPQTLSQTAPTDTRTVS